MLSLALIVSSLSFQDAKEKGFGKRQENQQRKRARGNLRMMRGRGGFAMRGAPGMRGMPFGRFQ